MELKMKSKAPAKATEWLNQQVGNAIHGLVAAVLTRGKVGEGAIEYLREAKKKGHTAVIKAALKGTSKEVADAVKKSVLDHTEKEHPVLDKLPADLKSAVVEEAAKKNATVVIKKANMPPVWADPATLPPILIGDKRLSDEDAKTVLATLPHVTLTTTEPLIVAP
ncbi:MAG: hypothetical protein QM744_19665 [Mesorhizobium sp.]